MRGSTPALQDIGSIGAALRSQLAEVMVLPDSVVDPILVALFARGHVLIEGIPGTGKTLLARTLARITGLGFNRIQFTNDLMPSDITGSSVWRPNRGEFEFIAGPLFADVVLADEINRTSPRTLSCLLEAMESGTVSTDGETRALPESFFVLATRNPIEFHGTYPLPEAALDRFLMRVSVGYPESKLEVGLYLGENPLSKLESLLPVLDGAQLQAIRARVPAIGVREPIAIYAYEVVAATREHESVALGLSPRAAMAWIRSARARALIHGRDYVLPDDLKTLAQPVLAHRILLKGGGDASELLDTILAKVAVKL